MNKYKVEIVQTDTFVIDVEAENEEQAKEIADMQWDNIAKNGTHHYYQSEDTVTEFGTIYDVTNTDDPFNPEEEDTDEEPIQEKDIIRNEDGDEVEQ